MSITSFVGLMTPELAERYHQAHLAVRSNAFEWERRFTDDTDIDCNLYYNANHYQATQCFKAQYSQFTEDELLAISFELDSGTDPSLGVSFVKVCEVAAVFELLNEMRLPRDIAA